MDCVGVSTAVLMGSSLFTFTLRQTDGFTLHHENNLELLKVRKSHVGRFEVWPTLDPLAKDNLSLLEEYLSRGASGLKLYVGHAFSYGLPPRYLFHTTSIDSDLLEPVYQFCERRNVPICLHVNTTKNAPGFAEEFEQVLQKHPSLTISAPHWMLATRRPSYLKRMLQQHCNLITDTSLGQDLYLEAGMKVISDNYLGFRKLVLEFPDRFMLGSDIVCTTAPHKTVAWMSMRIQSYFEMLAEPEFRCPVSGELRAGLRMPKPVLEKVVGGNASRVISQVGHA